MLIQCQQYVDVKDIMFDNDFDAFLWARKLSVWLAGLKQRSFKTLSRPCQIHVGVKGQLVSFLFFSWYRVEQEWYRWYKLAHYELSDPHNEIKRPPGQGRQSARLTSLPPAAPLPLSVTSSDLTCPLHQI